MRCRAPGAVSPALGTALLLQACFPAGKRDVGVTLLLNTPLVCVPPTLTLSVPSGAQIATKPFPVGAAMPSEAQLTANTPFQWIN